MQPSTVKYPWHWVYLKKVVTVDDDFTNWKKDEPNDEPQHSPENCVQLWSDEPHLWK